MKSRSLRAFIDTVEVGQLSEQGAVWQFEYSQDWLNNPNGFDLSPALPRTQKAIQDGASSRPVQWFFDNLLPNADKPDTPEVLGSIHKKGIDPTVPHFLWEKQRRRSNTLWYSQTVTDNRACNCSSICSDTYLESLATPENRPDPQVCNHERPRKYRPGSLLTPL